MTRKIKLTQGMFATVDAEDYEELNKVNWHYLKNDGGYAIRNKPSVNGKRGSEWMHRVIAKTPKDLITDHINGDTLDNRKENLRAVTHGQNAKNARKIAPAKSRHKGVNLVPMSGNILDGWVSQIQKDGKVHTHYHRSEIEAALKYNEMAEELFEEYAVFNELNLMSLHDYQQKARRTFPEKKWLQTNLSNFSMGLAGEVGEVVDEIKKVIHHGHELDVEALELEFGDVLWYLTSLATALKLDMDTIAKKNVAKLEKRYKKGFTEEESINREEDTVWENLSESERQFIHNEERKRAWR